MYSDIALYNVRNIPEQYMLLFLLLAVNFDQFQI